MGHYPLECFYWICTVCHRPHPHHKSIDCPARPENQTNRSPEENPEETNETTTLPIPNLETTQESSLHTPSASPHPESSQERPTAPPTSPPELPNASEHRTRLQVRNHRLQTISHPATHSSSVTTPPYLRLISPSLVRLITCTCTTTPSLGLTPHSLGLDTTPHLLLLSDSTRSRTTFPLTHFLTHSTSLHLLFSSISCTVYKSMNCRLSPKLELFNITP